MKKNSFNFVCLFVLSLFFMTITTVIAQNSLSDFNGKWEGKISNPLSFNFKILVKRIDSDTYRVKINNQDEVFNSELKREAFNGIVLKLTEDTSLKLRLHENGEELFGFLKSGMLLYATSLKQTTEDVFVGQWQPLMIKELISRNFYLDFGLNDDGSFYAYPFFGDKRFSGTWAGDYRNDKGSIFFKDAKTGLSFHGKLVEDKIELGLYFLNALIETVELKRSRNDWVFDVRKNAGQALNWTPKNLQDGWVTKDARSAGLENDLLNQMIKDIRKGDYPDTHSVLIAKNGALLFEKYFDGHGTSILHDTRSASKSIGSAMIGIAIDEKSISSLEEKLYDYVPVYYQYTVDSIKSKITLKHLITMSSGLDVSGLASEYNYQNTEYWLKTVLEAPTIHEPGSYSDYGSANPFLLGICLNKSLRGRSMEFYIDEKLMAPLGIRNYILQVDDSLVLPYFGGGIHLTSRDMLIFGQLYLNQGIWSGKRIISKDWISESFKKHVQLQDVPDKNEYGYQWWHNTYRAKDKDIKSIEARGNGGQYIFVLPELNVVAVITSMNFKIQQPEQIMEKYILPAVMN